MIRTLAGFALASLVVGCGQAAIDPTDAQIAADGTQAMEASSQSTDLGEIVFENVSVADPLQASAQLGGAAKLVAPDCVAHEIDPTDPATAHLILTDCTGPFGLLHIDGDVVATFSASTTAAGALHVEIEGMNLTADGQPVTFSAIADVSFPSPTTRSVVWTMGSWNRTNENGELVDHESDLEIALDLPTRCATANGSAWTTVASRVVSTEIHNYELCRDVTTGAAGCPMGTVSHTGGASGRTLTVKFNDTDVATVIAPRAGSFSVDMTCTPIP